MLEVIYEDKFILVAYKPAGIASQTSRLGQQDMVSLLKNYRAGKGEEPYIGLIHRLDQPVEGIMLFAKTREAAADLSKQVKDRELGKYYYAITQEAPDPRQGTLHDHMVSDKKANTSYIVTDASLEAKAEGFSFYMDEKEAKKRGLKVQEAKLSYKTAAQSAILKETEQALLDIELGTGRHHQIRLQFAHLGYPLLNDKKYGSDRGSALGLGRNVALCSYRLEFIHPGTKEKMNFSIRPKGDAFACFFSEER